MESKRGKIITFYSYKGGTGRSMALVNLACLLSRRADVKKGVLAIDWDLEAPGLHWFFRDARSASTPPVPSGGPRKGVIELFAHLDSGIQNSSSDPLGEEAAQEIVGKVAIEDFVTSTPISRVSLMSAGCFDSDYGERVSRFDWRRLFERAPSLIRCLGELLASKYDYVLVDSRTGVNDISGICTALLPDQLVLVFTPNHQSLITGIESVRRATRYRMQSDDLRQLAVFPLPSRVDLSEPQLLEKWRFGDPSQQEDQQGYQSRFEALFTDVYGLPSCSLKNYFDEVQIQHVPRYSYGEEIAVLQERGNRLSISRSYATVSDILATDQSPWTMPPAGPADADLKPGLLPAATKIEAAKEYLSEDRYKLKLRDLTVGEISFILKSTERIGLQEQPTKANFAERLHTYEALANDLLHIQALIGYWGEAAHRSLLGLGPKRICDQIPMAGGMTVWVYSRWYPATLLLYSGGIAAVAARRYENLRTLMLTPVEYPLGGSDFEPTLVGAVVRAMLELDRMEVFKGLPDLERRHTPRSDYLHRVLGPILEESLFLGLEFEEAFDRFEALYALEYAHRYDRASLGEFRYWGPPGRFAWKIGRANSPLDGLIKEAAVEGASWGPIRAGLFAGSLERFNEVANGLQQLFKRSFWS
jgi:Mrp family chromosome partitioning ATPase